MGEEQQEEHKHLSTNYMDYKIVLSAILSVLLGAVAILALVNFGMNVQRKFDGEMEAQAARDHIDSIIAVDYEADQFEYSGLLGEETLSQKLEFGKEEKAFVVDSNDKLARVIEAITGIDGSTPFYQVKEGFFNSSSVIVVPVEGSGITDASVKSVTRDENYNIQIDIAKTQDATAKTGKFVGRAFFIKLRNIQPLNVTVNFN